MKKKNIGETRKERETEKKIVVKSTNKTQEENLGFLFFHTFIYIHAFIFSRFPLFAVASDDDSLFHQEHQYLEFDFVSVVIK